MIDSDAASPNASASQQPGREPFQISPAASSLDSDASFWATPAHSIASYEAFLRELPELMESHRGWCAAYVNGVRVGIGPRRCREFYKELNEKGCDGSQLLVFTIEPPGPPHEIEIAWLPD